MLSVGAGIMTGGVATDFARTGSMDRVMNAIKGSNDPRSGARALEDETFARFPPDLHFPGCAPLGRHIGGIDRV